MDTKKNETLRNEHGVIYIKRQLERTLIYLRFLRSGLDPRVHLVNSLWKVCNIVGKILKRTEGLFLVGGVK